MDFDDFSEFKSKSSFLRGLRPYLKAALIFAIPFIIVDAFNYFSAGTAQVISWPVMGILYGGCGALAAKFQADGGGLSGTFPLTGAKGGLCLWVISTAVNLIISLIAGTLSLGSTLLLGLPYLCICAPVQLIASGLVGALGGWLYGKVSHRGTFNDFSY